MATEVKICGLKSEAVLDAALDAGADYVGLVHFAKSPRAVDIATARALSRRAHERGRAKVVVLLVDPDDAVLDRVRSEVEPDLIQLHGSETVERVAEIRARLKLPIMKAIGVASKDDVAAASGYLEPGVKADILLFDAKPPATSSALPGGNGLIFDWHMLDDVKGRLAFALAGGLTPENVADAVRLTGAAIVDVSSGVENRPGEKDEALIRRFLREAKAAKEAS